MQLSCLDLSKKIHKAFVVHLKYLKRVICGVLEIHLILANFKYTYWWKAKTIIISDSSPIIYHHCSPNVNHWPSPIISSKPPSPLPIITTNFPHYQSPTTTTSHQRCQLPPSLVIIYHQYIQSTTILPSLHQICYIAFTLPNKKNKSLHLQGFEPNNLK